MNRFLRLILFIVLLPSLAFSKPLEWELRVKKAEHMVSMGQFEQAINYLVAQTKSKDLDVAYRFAIAANAVTFTFRYGDKRQALFIVKPVYDELVKKYGTKDWVFSWATGFLIETYLRREEYDKALEYANLALKSAFTKSDLAEAYSNLADVYRERKEFTLAIKNYMKAEQLFKQLNDKNKYNSNLSSLYNNLASTYSKMGEFQKALVNYKVSLKMKKDKERSYYKTLFNMASTYRSLGEVDKAKHHLIEISDYYLKSEGENSLDYIRIENELGVLEDDYGHYNEALSHYKKVLSYGERLGREELKALALKNMGGAYNSLGNNQLAESCLEKSLAIYEKLPPSINLAANYESFASLASEKNSYQQELEFYDRALAVRESLHQQNDPDYARVLTNKAMAYQKHNDYQKAEALYQQTFNLLQKVEPKGQKMGFLLINQATLRVSQKEYAKAEPMLLEAIEMLKQTVGENHPDVAYAYNNLAMVYSVMNQRQKAVDCYKKAVAISKATEGSNHSSTKLYNRNLLLETINQRVSRRHG